MELSDRLDALKKKGDIKTEEETAIEKKYGVNPVDALKSERTELSKGYRSSAMMDIQGEQTAINARGAALVHLLRESEKDPVNLQKKVEKLERSLITLRQVVLSIIDDCGQRYVLEKTMIEGRCKTDIDSFHDNLKELRDGIKDVTESDGGINSKIMVEQRMRRLASTLDEKKLEKLLNILAETEE